MNDDQWFRHAELPHISKPALRMGLAGNYGVTADDMRHAAERGVNFWLWGTGFGKVTPVLKELLAKDREGQVVSVLAMALTPGMVRRKVERSLRALSTDYLDCYQLGWIGRTSRYSPAIADALDQLKQEGKIRTAGLSIHDRKRAGALCRDSNLELFMVRYNAKHPGAEQDIFPHLQPKDPVVVSYTATSWRQLLKPIKGIELPPWPGDAAGETPPPLTGALCYRFCLSNPRVHVVLTGPKNRAQLDENLDALEAGPLSDEELAWVSDYGRQVKAKKRLPFI